MAQEFKETAHLKTDLKKYQQNYDHIFNKAKCECEECMKEKSSCNQQDSTEARQ